MANSDLQINSSLLTVAKPSQKNALTELGRGLQDFGKIQQNNYNQKQQDELTNMQLETGRINMDDIRAKVSDKFTFVKLVESGKTLDEFDGSFKTPEYISLAQDFGDKKRKVSDSIQTASTLATINSQFSKNNKFDIDGAITKLTSMHKNNEINPRAYASVVDTIYKNQKQGIYKEENKSISLSDQIKLNNITKEQEKDKQLNKDLVTIESNYKKLFDKPMSTAQKLSYKKNGELPYLEYGSKHLNTKRKGLIDANIEIEKALGQLDKFTFEEIDEVAGWFQGMNPLVSSKDALGKLTPRQKEIRTILGHINSDKMHELYGAALTGGEVGRSKTWNLDLDQSTTSLLTAVNQLRHKNTVQFKNNTYGVYGVPKDNMTFGKFNIPTNEKEIRKEHQKETGQTSTTTMSREDKIKFLQGK